MGGSSGTVVVGRITISEISLGLRAASGEKHHQDAKQQHGNQYGAKPELSL